MNDSVQKVHDNSDVYCTLLAARAAVDEGWIRGRSRTVDEDGNLLKRCALVAIHNAAYGDRRLITRCVKRLARAIGSTLLHGGPPASFVVVSWNDKEGQTKKGVLRGFDLALAERE